MATNENIVSRGIGLQSTTLTKGLGETLIFEGTFETTGSLGYDGLIIGVSILTSTLSFSSFITATFPIVTYEIDPLILEGSVLSNWTSLPVIDVITGPFTFSPPIMGDLSYDALRIGIAIPQDENLTSSFLAQNTFSIINTRVLGTDYYVKTVRNKSQPSLQLQEKIKSLIGKGTDLPFYYDENGVKQNEGVKLINDSIQMILSTCKGSRLFEPEFGSNLCRLVFEPLDDILFSKLKVETVTALQQWEKRIVITDVNVSKDDTNAINNNYVYIQINYKLRNTNVEGNYVYPFKTDGFYTRE